LLKKRAVIKKIVYLFRELSRRKNQAMPFLSKISLPALKNGTYLERIPSLKNGLNLELKNNVTFFVGENGSGKSTVLEGIAEHCGFNLRGVTATTI
jgi:predicted ATPase